MKLIVSTIGTSLLTNQLKPEERSAGLLKKLNDTANYQRDEISKEQWESQPLWTKIMELKQRAETILKGKEVKDKRRASAELNSLLGIYEDQIKEGEKDTQILITTDTGQGKLCGQIIEKFLRNQGINNVQLPSLKNFSTKDTRSFTGGIKELIKWCDETLPGYQQSRYEIIFNLVGGFKSIQAYMEIIGMFYANEIVYIFEAEGAQLIKIPRLPIEIKSDDIYDKYAVQFGLMNQGYRYSPNAQDIVGIPELMIETTDQQKVTISGWGTLLWNRSKRKILSGQLLNFPRLRYEKTFQRDFQNIGDPKEKIKLQETMAKVSKILVESNGNTQALTKGGIQYSPLEGKHTPDGNPIYHFRVSDFFRVSCAVADGVLNLRKYGAHDYVNNNP